MLNSTGAEYLVVGGYAVNYYGYSRSTGDIDIWVRASPENAGKVASALHEFGFKSITADLFTTPDQIVRMGVPPLRLEILTSISGVDFEDCYAGRQVLDIDGVAVPLLALDDLRRNKRAAGRPKDIADLEELG